MAALSIAIFVPSCPCACSSPTSSSSSLCLRQTSYPSLPYDLGRSSCSYRGQPSWWPHFCRHRTACRTWQPFLPSTSCRAPSSCFCPTFWTSSFWNRRRTAPSPVRWQRPKRNSRQRQSRLDCLVHINFSLIFGFGGLGAAFEAVPRKRGSSRKLGKSRPGEKTCRNMPKWCIGLDLRPTTVTSGSERTKIVPRDISAA